MITFTWRDFLVLFVAFGLLWGIIFTIAMNPRKPKDKTPPTP